MEINVINEYDALNFLIKEGHFEKYSHEVRNHLYLGFKRDDDIVGVASIQNRTSVTKTFFFTCKRKCAQEISLFVKSNWDKLWELMNCNKLLTFIKPDNKPSLYFSTLVGFKRLCVIKDYYKDSDVVLKELNRGDEWLAEEK